jgi:glucose-1-phosphate cytidylyltransferase
MKSVLLAGGLGTRLREETEVRPKPMIEIGNRPILWHLMNIYSASGFSEFIICAGYKSEIIKQYFSSPIIMSNDFQINYTKTLTPTLLDDDLPKWDVIVSDTGHSTMTGGRINRIKKYVRDERFFCTYGDGLADIDLKELLDFHRDQKTVATITAVHPTSRFGQLKIDEEGRVGEFSEKPTTHDWINGGFFVFEPEIFDFLNDDCVLEADVLPLLAQSGQLSAYKHEGFWQPMDTYRESKLLNQLWSDGNAPWKIW